ncbi:MAG: copper amine oxidase N-terminal domain-containing protein, partial [Actinobacteria bacterium]|nr:copper amine oxidase N-terminal domain-containing protein [Actinomycetota bacterium]
QYFINGQTPGITMDAAPYIDSDRTFVPVRFLGNALGVEDKNITWDDSQGRAALQAGSTRAELTIGVKQIITNGQAKDIDVAPQLQPPGRTFLPARFVCEALGFEVDWQNDKYVLVWPKGQPKPDIEAVKQYIQQINNSRQEKGYTIPITTNLNVDTYQNKSNPHHVDIKIIIDLSKPQINHQYQDAYNIIASKFGDSVAREVVDYAKQKKDYHLPLELKEWTINDQSTHVGSSPMNPWVSIMIWELGIRE